MLLSASRVRREAYDKVKLTPSRREFDLAYPAVSDAPIVFFQPTLHHASDRLPTQREPAGNIGQSHEASQIDNQSPERARDFRVGFDKGGDCDRRSGSVDFSTRKLGPLKLRFRRALSCPSLTSSLWPRLQ